jgi:hypothetical protein
MTEQRLACPSCQTVLQVRDEFRGKTVKCPACQNRLSVPAAAPQPAAAAAEGRWYLARNRQKAGPYSAAQLRQMATAGQLAAADMLLPDGEAKWVAAGSVNGIFPAAPSPTAVRKPPPLPPPAAPSRPETIRTAPPPVPPAARGGDGPPAASPAPKPPRSRLPWLLAGGGALAVFAAAGVLTFLLTRPSEPKKGDEVADAGKDRKSDSARDGKSDSGKDGKSKDGGKNPPEEKPRLDTTFIAPSFAAAVVVHPARLLRSPSMESLPQEKMFANFAVLGLDPRQAERVVLLVDPFPGGNVLFSGGAVVRFARPVDAGKTLKVLFPAAAKASDQGKAYFRLDAPFAGAPVCVHQADDKTVVVAPEPTLKKMLTARKEKSPLIDRLARTDLDGDVVAVLAVEPIRKPAREAFQGMARDLPPQLAGAARLPDQVQSLTLTLNLTGKDLLTLDLEASDAESAQKVHALARSAIDLLKQAYPQVRPGLLSDAPPDLAGPLGKLADDLVNGIGLTKDGARVSIGVDMPQGLPALMKKLGPLAEQLLGGQTQSTKSPPAPPAPPPPPLSPPKDVRELAVAWFRDANRFGPTDRVVGPTDRVVGLVKDMLNDQVRFGDGFVLSLGPKLMKSEKPTLVVGWGEEVFPLELTAEQAAQSAVRGGEIGVRKIKAPDDVGRYAEHRLSGLKLDRNTLDPGTRLTGSVPYQRLAGKGEGFYSLRLTYLVGGTQVTAYSHLEGASLPRASGSLSFSFPSLDELKLKHEGPVVALVDLVMYFGPDRVGPVGVVSTPAAALIQIAPKGQR